MRRLAALLLALALPAAAAAESCGPLPDRADTREALLSALSGADSAEKARAAEKAVWMFWYEAPDPRAQELIDRARDRLRWHDPQAALEAADDLTAYCPAYAEGWNQKAIALFMLERWEDSLAAIEQVLAREPRHFGALSGRAQILMRQGRVGRAQAARDAAAEIHPWIGGRRPPEPPGEEL